MASTNSLKTIRRRVGRLSGDMLLCTATANSALTTSFTDALNLNHEQSILLNRQGLFSGGTSANLGRTVRVSANDKTTQTLTFTPAAATAPQIGDELELWNERDEGVTPAEVNNLINDAILDATEMTPIPITSDAFAFDAQSPVIDIDTDILVDEVADGSNWEVITGVDYQPNADYDVWYKVEPADFKVDRYARTIEIMNRPRWLADGGNIRVRGANLAQTLSSDSSTTAVNFQWLTHYVAAMALGLRLEKAYDRKDVEGRMLNLQAAAAKYEPRLRLRLRGRLWRLT